MATKKTTSTTTKSTSKKEKVKIPPLPQEIKVDIKDLLGKLTADVKKSVHNLDRQEARYLVDLYYQMQHFRIQADNQTRILTEEDAKVSRVAIQCMAEMYKKQEAYCNDLLTEYAKSQPIGRWLKSITGIAGTLSAGLIAHIDIKKCETAGAIWRYAGLDPTVVWEKGQKRPWNAKLKTLCWKIGQSFIKVSNNPKDIYGKIYKQRKEWEIQQNESGAYAEFAAQQLKNKKYGKDTQAYKAYIQGKLPDAHITARAARYAVKIFLSHLFDVWYELDRGKKPPKPFAIGILGHAHMIDPPMPDDFMAIKDDLEHLDIA